MTPLRLGILVSVLGASGANAQPLSGQVQPDRIAFGNVHTGATVEASQEIVSRAILLRVDALLEHLYQLRSRDLELDSFTSFGAVTSNLIRLSSPRCRTMKLASTVAPVCTLPKAIRSG
jgi:hypothetical protein